jgi:aryl-alcohol dehydrogenase-like predicted oxidoreductase
MGSPFVVWDPVEAVCVSSLSITLAQLALRWTVQRPCVCIALASARNAAQTLENTKAGEFSFTDEEMDFIELIVG